MRDQLLDIIKNTYGLGKIGLVKIVGDANQTRLNALADERLFVVIAKFHNPVADFVGRFGMPNLSRLNAIITAEEYREDAVFSVNRVNKEPESFVFKNKSGDFTNDYRLMGPGVIDNIIKDITFKGAAWHAEFEPSVLSIQRMRSQASINSDQTAFSVKTDSQKNLKFKFGDPASLSGEFVFQAQVENQLKNEKLYPVQPVLNILSLGGDKIMKVSDDGIMCITVDSGMALYEYIIPALSK